MAWLASCKSSATRAGILSGMPVVNLLLNYLARPLACPWQLQSPDGAVNWCCFWAINKHQGHQQHRSATECTTFEDYI